MGVYTHSSHVSNILSHSGRQPSTHYLTQCSSRQYSSHFALYSTQISPSHTCSNAIQIKIVLGSTHNNATNRYANKYESILTGSLFHTQKKTPLTPESTLIHSLDGMFVLSSNPSLCLVWAIISNSSLIVMLQWHISYCHTQSSDTASYIRL